MATKGKKVEFYYTSQGTTTGVDSSALLFDGANLQILTHGKTFKGTDTWNAASTSDPGYIPKLVTGGGTIATQASEYVLTYKTGTDTTPTWKLLPVNAYKNDNDNTWQLCNTSQEGYVPKSTANKILRANDSGVLYWGDDANDHYTSHLYIGESQGNTNTAVSGTAGNSNGPYLKLFDDSTFRNQIRINAGTGISVTSDTSGNLLITNTAPASGTSTDVATKQTDNNDNADRPILLKNGTGTGEVTTGTLFADGVTVNPSTNSLSISGNLSVTGTASFSNNVTCSTASNVWTDELGVFRKDLGYTLANWVTGQHSGPFSAGRSSNSMCVTIGVTDDNYGYIQTKGNCITTPGDLVLLPGGGTVYYNNTSNYLIHSGNISSHIGSYMPWNNVSSLDANSASPGWYNVTNSISNSAHSNHSSLIYVNNVGTPYQLQIPDSTVMYIYKRYYSGGWSSWNKISAGYADSAGSVSWSNVTDRGSSSVIQALYYINGSSGDYPRLCLHIPNVNWANMSVDTSAQFHFRLSNSASGSYTTVFAGSFYQGSDRTLKKDIKLIDKDSLSDLFDATDKLLKSFTWKSTSKPSYGFVAQELEQYIPEAIINTHNDVKTVAYDVAYAKIIASLVNEIKNLKKEVSILKQKR